jgi:hypothetical protein
MTVPFIPSLVGLVRALESAECHRNLIEYFDGGEESRSYYFCGWCQASAQTRTMIHHRGDCTGKEIEEALAQWRDREALAGDEGLVEAVARSLEVGERVTCAVCGRQKQPRGRSAALEAASGYCTDECSGYREPFVGDLWPGESRVEFGFPKALVELRRKQARAALTALDTLLAKALEGGG